MSYARFGEDGSDVYVFCGSGYLECCACALTPGDGPLHFAGDPAKSVDDMLAHLTAHRDQGHVVPQRAFDTLADPVEREAIARIFADAEAERRRRGHR